jgi:hypothetical protein
VNLNRKILPTPRNPAIQHCCIAEKRSRRESLSKGLGIVETEVRADEAYRKALPELIGYENIRDFIACVTFGMAHGNVTAFQGTKLLAGARLGLIALRQKPALSVKNKKEHPEVLEIQEPSNPERSQSETLSSIITIS